MGRCLAIAHNRFFRQLHLRCPCQIKDSSNADYPLRLVSSLFSRQSSCFHIFCLGYSLEVSSWFNTFNLCQTSQFQIFICEPVILNQVHNQAAGKKMWVVHILVETVLCLSGKENLAAGRALYLHREQIGMDNYFFFSNFMPLI